MIEKTDLDGVLLVYPQTPHEDFRGVYRETYNEALYKAMGIHAHFVVDDISTSRQFVLRGIHGDATTAKLISCLYGALYVIVVNNDPDSPQYRQWQGFTLSDRNCLQLYVPPKFGNGHLVLTDMAIFHYKQSRYYYRVGQFTIKWNDPSYDFWWPVAEPILSERDR